MKCTLQAPCLAGLLGLLAVQVAATTSVPVTYCASINTASGAGNSSIWQSDGLCHDFCLSSYAFAVIKDSECWCSDVLPDSSVRVDNSKCNKACPGYPSDLCGGDGLWGYMALNKAPTATAASNGVTTSQTTTTPLAQASSSVITSSTASSVRSSSTSTTSVATSTDSSTTTDSTQVVTTPSVSVATVTQGGSVSLQTVTVFPTVTASSGANAAGITTSQNGLTTGQAVGIAVGVLGFVVIVGAFAAWLFIRRRRRQNEQAAVDRSNSQRGSSAGMLSTPRTEMEGSWDGDAPSMGRRNSRLMPHDPRMDPFAPNIYTRFENKSRESVNTLRDDQDYSRRVLRTTNPDPTDAE